MRTEYLKSRKVANMPGKNIYIDRSAFGRKTSSNAKLFDPEAMWSVAGRTFAQSVAKS